MQGSADTLPLPIAFPQRPAVTAPVHRPQWDHAEPESQPEPGADPNAHTRGNAQQDTIELA
jgi:hypothetical protein